MKKLFSFLASTSLVVGLLLGSMESMARQSPIKMNQLKKSKYSQTEPVKVSKSAWQAISNWSTDTKSLLQFIKDRKRTAVLDQYIKELLFSGHPYGRGSILSQAEKYDKQVLDQWNIAYKNYSPDDNFHLMRYLITYKPLTFNLWHTSQGNLLTLNDFVSRTDRSLYNAWYKAYASPKRRGLSVVSYNRKIDSKTKSELRSIFIPPSYNRKIDSKTKRLRNPQVNMCVCQMVEVADSQGNVVENHPSTSVNNNIDDSDYTSFGIYSKEHNYNVDSTAYGAFRSIDGSRSSRHKSYGVENSYDHNSTEFDVIMTCTNSIGAQCRKGQGCVGDLNVGANYSSAYSVYGEASGIPSKGTNSIIGSSAKFSLNVQGESEEIYLFRKMGGVGMEYHANWEPKATVGTTVNLAEITAAIVADNYDSIDDDLISDTADNIANMVTKSGNNKQVDATMRVSFDSLHTAPFPLSPNEIYHFKLDSYDTLKARGYGVSSLSEFGYGSSGSVMYAAKNFSCGLGSIAPQPKGLWFYADLYGPDDIATLQSEVVYWFSLNGMSVDASNHQGVFPSLIDDDPGDDPYVNEMTYKGDFPYFEIRGGAFGGWPTRTETVEYCLPAGALDNCEIDFGHTHSSPWGSTDGFGIYIDEINSPGGGQTASHDLNANTGCLTSTVTVRAKRRQRGWYRGHHEIYLKCQ